MKDEKKRRKPRRKGSGKNSNYSGPKKGDSCNTNNEASNGEGNRNASRSDVGSLNDIGWYAHFPSLLAAAGSFPFPYRPGMEMKLLDGTAGQSVPMGNFFIPGVMAMQWLPSLGKSQTAVDPASIVGKEVYARVRKVYSGGLDVDAPDFVMYLGALDSIYLSIGMLKRLYRISATYTPESYVFPDTLLAACLPRGWANYRILQAIKTRRTLFFQKINELVLMSRKFTCPSGMDIMNRHYWMSDNVYGDAASLNSQLYVFTPRGFYQYKELNTPDGVPAAGLQMYYFSIGTMPSTPDGIIDAICKVVEDQINALVAWDDAYTISGYLRRAYENEPDFIVDELQVDERVEVSYVPEVLSQIENSRCVLMDGAEANVSCNVTQDPKSNAVLCNPTLPLTGTSVMNDDIMLHILPTLSIRSEVPSVTETTIASRLCACVTGSAKVGSNVDAEIIAGTEIPLTWVMFWSKTGSTNFPIYQYVPTVYKWEVGQDITTYNAGLVLATLPQFDWRPTSFAYLLAGPTGMSNVILPMMDIHNITVLSYADLRNLHRICTYSEFNAFSDI